MWTSILEEPYKLSGLSLIIELLLFRGFLQQFKLCFGLERLDLSKAIPAQISSKREKGKLTEHPSGTILHISRIPSPQPQTLPGTK